MSILTEYLKFYHDYTCKYGPKTAVLMQVGSFYEIYGEHSKPENAEELSRVLNMVLTKKKAGYLILGFPCVAIDRYLSVLIENDYTVIVVDQVKTQLSIRRVVVDVVSPATYMSSSRDDNYLVLVYVDKYKHVGMSAIDVTTGYSVVHECYSDKNDIDVSFDEALSFVKIFSPREAVLSGNIDNTLITHLDVTNIPYHTFSPAKKKQNVEYQNSVLDMVFENKIEMCSNIELIGLEKMPYALASYVLLIEFVYEHNPLLLKKLLPPEIFSRSKRLSLSTNTIDQLDILSKSDKNTLLGIMNKCSTKIGKRLLTKRILSPLVDPREIEMRYDQTEEFGKYGINIEDMLRQVVDIERLQRRMAVGILATSELANLVASYEAIVDLDRTVKGVIGSNSSLQAMMLRPDSLDALGEFLGVCRHTFETESSELCFRKGIIRQLDDLNDAIDREMATIRDFASDIGINDPRIEYTANAGHYILIGKTRRFIRKNDVVVKAFASSLRITSPAVDKASKNITYLTEQLLHVTQKHYKRVLDCMLRDYAHMFKDLVRFVSEIDVTRSNYFVSKLYNYCRPSVVTGKSYVDTKGLRHPVIERMDDGNIYVPNDLFVGEGSNGIVLYSMNSCGKTSLLRALGLSVILAQAGCFVPASSFTFSPFRCIMTKILTKDNIMKGQSSFVAEMSELRSILKRANDASTLVLADEITHGTEHTSGSAIFVSSVETLADRGVNFLFTTHLHSAYPLLQNIPNVEICHLSVAFDDGKIVFERKLKPGPGGSLYGLEVCELLGMDTDFIARAFQIRNMITPDKAERTMILPKKSSRYNDKKIILSCKICGYTPRLPTDMPLDTHHIKPQLLADENGMIDGIHKDSLSNLMVLCKQCHDKESWQII